MVHGRNEVARGKPPAGWHRDVTPQLGWIADSRRWVIPKRKPNGRISVVEPIQETQSLSKGSIRYETNNPGHIDRRNVVSNVEEQTVARHLCVDPRAFDGNIKTTSRQ